MAKVLVTGIAVIDHVFQMETMPDKAQKYRAQSMQIVGGGIAANAAVAVARLGGDATLMTRLGDDEIGESILRDLRRENVNLDATYVTTGARSAMSTVLVDSHGERLLVNYPGENLQQKANPPSDFDAALVDTRWPEAALATLVSANQLGKPGVLDAEAPVPERLVAAASHTVFSAQGLRDFTGAQTLEEGMAMMVNVPGWHGVTDGARGLYTPETDWIAAPKVDVKDTLGAGDVWHGAFTLALAEGQPLKQAITFAHAAAALKCTAFGGRKATPNRATVNQFIKDHMT